FALADGAPDVLALACEVEASDGGGASFVVDCGRLHAALEASDDPAARRLASFLVETRIDQTEPGKLPCHGPLGLRGEGGRTWWRGSYCLAPLASDPEPDATLARIAEWQALLRDLAERIERFHLRPGEVLLADNTRVLHGRDPYVDRGRLLWRLWAWTDAAVVPDNAYASSDTSLVAAEPDR
ncbi:MAG: TauD/TfdA family dioxygenase, partial [Acidimicrobiia bacterium]|nr:TauD/TfdA family dioxygenase [Acidimicrobiia bacterium]